MSKIEEKDLNGALKNLERIKNETSDLKEKEFIEILQKFILGGKK